MDYQIMHKNRIVAEIREDGFCNIHSEAFMPCNLWLEEDDSLDSRVGNLTNLYYWCASRVLTLDRAFAKEILNSLGQNQAVTDRERAAIAVSCHALTLTDVFWVKSKEENITFDEINLFDHSLSIAFVDVSLRGKSLTAQNAELLDLRDAAGDVSTQGVAPTAWVRRNGIFYLLKNGSTTDVEAELLASKIADCFKCDHIEYTPDEYDGIPVSSSRIITSKDRSMVPMEHIEIYAANQDTSALDIVLEKDAYSYHMMNIIDYLVGNTDRHWGNWGFLVDNNTNQLLRLHPLMDFNKAFTSYDDLDGAVCQTIPASQGRVSQKDAAVDAVQSIGLNMVESPQREWFFSDKAWEMFCQRLEALNI
ncbi:MAG: hypothetical protein IKE52_01130 [Mogibacterium sp.]|nr:hypothetical protein [Mogibacterium sp.]